METLKLLVRKKYSDWMNGIFEWCGYLTKMIEVGKNRKETHCVSHIASTY